MLISRDVPKDWSEAFESGVEVQQLLDALPSLEVRDSEENTPLLLAAK